VLLHQIQIPILSWLNCSIRIISAECHSGFLTDPDISGITGHV